MSQNLAQRIGQEFKTLRTNELSLKADTSAVDTALDTKVDKVTGKQLSTEDYTSTEKSKLAGIAAGAQVNTVTAVAGKTGAVVLAKADVGLGSVDNTSDANKPISTATQTALNTKVDKVTGKQLSTEDYTTAEKTKLAGIAAGAQVNTVTAVAGKTGNVTLAKSDVGLGNVDNTSDANKPVSTAAQAALNTKVDKVTGKQLSTEDYTSAEKSKLAGIAAGAQVNAVNSVAGKTGNVTLAKADVGLGNVDNTSDANKPVSTATQSALNGKVDKVSGYGLSQANFTSAEKSKLAGLESSRWKGQFVSEAALNTAFPTTEPGSYADVDSGAGQDVVRYIWDSNDTKWVKQSGVVAPLTSAQVKQLYEANPDTNAFTDTEKTKLAGIATGANNYTHPNSGVSAGTYKSVTVNAQGHVTGGSNPTTLSGYGITDAAPSSHVGSTGGAHGVATTSVAGFMSSADKQKLDGIAAGAQVNAVTSVAGKTGAVALTKGDVGLGNVDNTSDANKPVSTATQSALDLKANLASPALTGTPTAPTAASSTNTTQLATTAFVQAVNSSDTGSAATAVKLKTARTLTVGSTGKSFDGSANVTWSLAEIGAAASSHSHNAGHITSGTIADARLPNIAISKVTGLQTALDSKIVNPASGAAGDILYHNGTSYVRLPKGTNGQVLTMVNGLPAWSNSTIG